MTDRRHIRVPVLGKAVTPIGSDFVSLEAASGLVLLLAAVGAIVWANTDTAGYVGWWGRELTIGPGDLAITESLVHWVNDALMTIFFFVVGLEIKRELVTGELRDRSRAALPAVAAVGGMVVPALLYVAINVGVEADSTGGPSRWPPTSRSRSACSRCSAPRVPSSLKVFLLTLAIVDDIGAIVVIALFYSSGIEPALAGRRGRGRRSRSSRCRACASTIRSRTSCPACCCGCACTKRASSRRWRASRSDC